MSSTFTKKDRNRFRKMYPVKRVTPSYTDVLEGLNFDFGEITFPTGNKTVTHYFKKSFSSPPIVILTTAPAAGEYEFGLAIGQDQGLVVNQNVFIVSVTKDYVIVSRSGTISEDGFGGLSPKVFFHAVQNA